MSGPGSDSDGGGGGIEDDVSCDALHFRTSLNSPDPTVVGTLAKGDVLKLEQRNVNGPLLAVTNASKIAGSVAGVLLINLLRCMGAGHKYNATVLNVTGGNIEVEIRHV